MKIAILGAGWYGCHIALSLKGYCDTLDIYEKNTSVLSEASGNNQSRLHQGLHYPRSSKTRYESRDGFYRFQERYPNFSSSIKKNIYLIPKLMSIIDFNTYYTIMLGSGLEIEKINIDDLSFLKHQLIEGAISCNEKVILTSIARKYFDVKLKNNLKLSHPIQSVKRFRSKWKVEEILYDYIIDTTWGALHELNPELLNYFFEPTILFYLRLKQDFKFPAITLMDGLFFSIYPTEDNNIYTLSSVKHSPSGKFTYKKDAYIFSKNINNKFLKEKYTLMEKEVSVYINNFKDIFELVGTQLSIKTKPMGKSDDRSLKLTNVNNYLSVLPGKIDNIFQASDWVLGELSKQ
jgi:hypothetical protein